jgi:hypothetical protein
VERISGENNFFYGGEGKEALKSTLPESLGDMRDRGFSKRLGLALKKRKDQIFEMEGDFVKLKEAPPNHRHKQTQWQLIRTMASNGIGKNTRGSAGSAVCSNGHSWNEKKLNNFPCRSPVEEKNYLFSFREGAAELPAHTALPAKEEPFTFEDDPEERAAIQAESRKEEETRNGAAQVE